MCLPHMPMRTKCNRNSIPRAIHPVPSRSETLRLRKPRAAEAARSTRKPAGALFNLNSPVHSCLKFSAVLGT